MKSLIVGLPLDVFNGTEAECGGPALNGENEEGEEPVGELESELSFFVSSSFLEGGLMECSLEEGGIAIPRYGL